jgi:glycosyltransferase involved in cell wall biosynthesis
MATGGLLDKVREKGFRSSARVGFSILRQAMASKGSHRRQFVFLSPQIDVSGAPQVLLAVIEEFAASYDPRQLRLLTPHVLPAQLKRLNSLGIRVDRTADVMGPRLIKGQLGLQRNDFVLLNSAAVSKRYRHFVIRALIAGQLEHATWLIHEDVEQLAIVAPDLRDAKYLGLLRDLVESGRLEIFVPSLKSKTGYDRLLGTQKVKTLRLRVELEERYRRKSRPRADYSSLAFLMTGGPQDGRKGHLIALFAFDHFLRSSYQANPDRYRPFSLSLVGIGDDYVSEHCRLLGAAWLGDRLRTYPRMSHKKALAVAHGCNAVICCSFNEAFPLYVAEGMAMGHVVVRNDAGGVDEQLVEGVNGYRIDSDDIVQIGGVIEQMLNREKTSDGKLQKMGRASQELIEPYLAPSYLKSLGS